MRIVGIDPGVAPTVCLLITPEAGKPLAAQWWDELETAESTRVGTTNRLDASSPLITAILRECKPDAVILEKVSAHPREGVTSVFRFGRAYGICEAVTLALGYPLLPVLPQVWRRALDVPEGKTGSRLAACRISPTMLETFRLVKSHNRADSYLIAHYGWQQIIRRRFPIAESVSYGHS